MGYILRVIDAPQVSTPQQAEQFVQANADAPPSASDKFPNFTRLITREYPDLSEDDEDGDNDENVWEEGIDSAASEGGVKAIVVKEDVTDEALVHAIARAAVAAGLQLYDDEGQVLYRPDGSIIGTKGPAGRY